MPIGHHPAEAGEQAVGLGLLAGEQRDLLRVLPDPHQVEAEIGLVALLVEVELDQGPADQVSARRADDCVNERRPD
jgi:hypothetical protein